MVDFVFVVWYNFYGISRPCGKLDFILGHFECLEVSTMKNNKKMTAILAGVMAGVMLLSVVLGLLGSLVA